MNQQSTKQNVKRPNPLNVSDNLVESFRSLGNSVGKSVHNDVVNKIPEDMIRDMFAAGQPTSELKPNESVSVQPEEKQEKAQPRQLIRDLFTSDQQQTKQSIETIRQQLKTLAKQTNSPEIQKAVIEQPMEQQGIYHKTFFGRLLEDAQRLIKPDDALTEFKKAGTKRKRLGYWSQAKKTSYSLSEERKLATQAG